MQHPLTGELVSWKAAEEQGIVNTERGIFHNPDTGSNLPLQVAMQQGHLKGNVVSSFAKEQQLRIAPGTSVAECQQSPLCNDFNTIDVGARRPRSCVDIEAAICADNFKAVQHTLPPDSVDDVSAEQQRISAEDKLLVKSNIQMHTSRLSTNQDEASSGSNRSLKRPHRDDATALTLNELIAQNDLDLSRALIIHPQTRRPLTLRQAVDCGVLDANRSVVKDPATGERFTVAEAANSALLDMKTGDLWDSSVQQELSLADAVLEGLLPEDLPVAPGAMAFEEALERGLLDTQNGVFKDPSTGRSVPIHTALASGRLEPPQTNVSMRKMQRSLVSGDDPMAVPAASSVHGGSDHQDMSLAVVSATDLARGVDVDIRSAEKMGLVNREAGLFTDTRNGNQIPIHEALAAAYLKVKTPSTEVDEKDNKSTSSSFAPNVRSDEAGGCSQRLPGYCGAGSPSTTMEKLGACGGTWAGERRLRGG